MDVVPPELNAICGRGGFEARSQLGPETGNYISTCCAPEEKKPLEVAQTRTVSAPTIRILF